MEGRAVRRAKMMQVGAFTYGGGLNVRAWGEEAKRAGYTVVYCGGYAELWR